jgi:hypothetical protein
VAEVGFVVETTVYQTYTRTAAGITRSHKSKSGLRSAYCLPCRAPLLVPVETLIGSAT